MQTSFEMAKPEGGINFILHSPDSSFWETDFSPFLVLYTSLLWEPVALSSCYSFHWCWKAVRGPSAMHMLWPWPKTASLWLVRGGLELHGPQEKPEGIVFQRLQFSAKGALLGICLLSCADGNKLVLFPRWGGWEGQRVSHSSLLLWVPRGRENWGKPSRHSRYCSVCKNCCWVAIQARQYFLNYFLNYFIPPFCGYEKAMYNLALCREYLWSRINCGAPAMFWRESCF